MVRAAVERSSLRRVAGEVGVSHGTLHNFLERDFTPYGDTLAKIERWAARGGKGEPEPEALDLFTGYDRIVPYLGGVAPPGQAKAVKRDILEGIRRAIAATQPVPEWWYRLKEMVDNDEL